MTSLVMCEVSHQPVVDVGVAGDASEDLSALEGRLWIGAAVIQVPARDKHNQGIGSGGLGGVCPEPLEARGHYFYVWKNNIPKVNCLFLRTRC